ncbi:MAG: DNA translocase FtsK, partial [Patescibacteria group bacterium]
TILDMAGAEKLLGRGDMLFMAGDVAKPRRLQGALVTEREVKDVVKFLKTQAEAVDVENESELKIDFNAQTNISGRGLNVEDDVDDELYNDAKEVVIAAGKASASLLQRRLKVGYARAARLLDILEDEGLIGPGEGAKPREVYVKPGLPAQTDMPVNQMGGGVSVNEATIISADTPEAEREE